MLTHGPGKYEPRSIGSLGYILGCSSCCYSLLYWAVRLYDNIGNKCNMCLLGGCYLFVGSDWLFWGWGGRIFMSDFVGVGSRFDSF